MATNTNRPNFYILLDLDPDAPWDQEAFERALSVKRSEWSRQTNGVGQRVLEARKYLELLPQIRVVMQNPMQRNAEERVARVQQDEAYKKALEELEFRTAKGYITQDEIDELTRGFSLLAREKITKRIMVYIVNKPGQQPPNTIQPLAPELHQRIETYLEALGKKDLYELLGLSSSASSAELVTAADRLYNEMVRRPASSETTTKKNLAGDAKGIFSSDETHQSYDASLRLKSPKSLKDALEKLARAVNSKPNKAVVAREIELYLDRTRKDGWEDGLALGWFLEEADKQQWTIQSFPKKQTNEAPTSSQTSSTGYRPSQHYQAPEYTQMQQPYDPYQQPFQNRQPPPSPPLYQQQSQYQTYSYPPPIFSQQPAQPEPRRQNQGISRRRLLLRLGVLAAGLTFGGYELYRSRAPSPNGETLYQEDGSDSWKGWKGSPDWIVSKGVLTNDGSYDSNTIPPTIVMPYHVSGTADYAVETNILAVSSQTRKVCPGFGISVRGNGGSGIGWQGYWAGVNYACAGTVIVDTTMYIQDNNPDFNKSNLAENPFDPGNSWHTYRVEVKGHNIKVFLDGYLLVEVTNNEFPNGGQVGLASFNSQLNISSFKVFAI